MGGEEEELNTMRDSGSNHQRREGSEVKSTSMESHEVAARKRRAKAISKRRSAYFDTRMHGFSRR